MVFFVDSNLMYTFAPEKVTKRQQTSPKKKQYDKENQIYQDAWLRQ